MAERRPLAAIAALLAGLLLSALAAPTGSFAGALAPTMEKQLAESRYVYIQSERKDGSFGAPAEIWFLVHEGSVYVGSKKTSWRAKRIAAGRTAAKIHVFMPSGPSFDAVGKIVDDPALWKLLFETFAKKYPDGWPSYEKTFREGAKDGTQALIRYSPK
jgi:hypothetical protein